MKKHGTFWKSFSAFFADTSPFMVFVGKLAMLVVVNICLAACSVPLVTAGAAATAAYAVLLDRSSLTVVSAFTAFFQRFRRHWKAATLAWLPALAAGALLLWDLRFLLVRELSDHMLLLAPLLLAGAVWGITLEWLPPVLAATGCSARAGLKTAFLLGLRELWRSFLLLAMDAVPVVLFFLYAQTFMTLWGFWSLLGFGLIALVKLLLMEPVLKALTPEP